jgi:hypothetical protein
MSGPLLFAVSDSIIGQRLGIRPPVVVIALFTGWAAKLLADEDRAVAVEGPVSAGGRL